MFAQLAAHPHLGADSSHIRPGYRRGWCGRHVIYYRLIDDGIAVIRVLHDRMRADRHLR